MAPTIYDAVWERVNMRRIGGDRKYTKNDMVDVAGFEPATPCLQSESRFRLILTASVYNKLGDLVSLKN